MSYGLVAWGWIFDAYWAEIHSRVMQLVTSWNQNTLRSWYGVDIQCVLNKMREAIQNRMKKNMQTRFLTCGALGTCWREIRGRTQLNIKHYNPTDRTDLLHWHQLDLFRVSIFVLNCVFKSHLGCDGTIVKVIMQSYSLYSKLQKPS